MTVADRGKPADVPDRPTLPALLDEDSEGLYEDAPCGYLSTLLDGTIVKVNRTFLAWTGYEHDELVGSKRLPDLFTAGGKIFYETHYAPMLRMQGMVREIAMDLVCRGGRLLPTLINAVARRDEDGTPVLVRTTVFDATERRAYERELMFARRSAERAEARARILAQTLQESLIPPSPPQIPGLEVGAAYRPAGHGDEVGGDFYDMFETSDGNWGIVLGDVAGKGAGAATVTALVRYTVRALAVQHRQPDVVLSTLNDALLRQGSERFCTAVYGVLQPRNNGAFLMTLSSGGHPLPYLLSDAQAPTTIGEPGDLLGVWAQPELRSTPIVLQQGDAVVFFTDGVTEAWARAAGSGQPPLEATLRSARDASAAEIVERIVGEAVATQDGVPRDDIAVVALRIP